MVLALHCLALRPGIEPPGIAVVDHLPKAALFALVAARQMKLQALAPGRMRVIPDMDPLRSANELGDVAPGPGQRLGDLDAAGAAADDAPALTFTRNAVVPPRRVKRGPGETVAARNIRKKRPMQKARGADKNVRRVGPSRGGLDLPTTFAEPGGCDLLVEADEIRESTVAGDVFDVGPDLGGRSVFARPVIVGLEGELVLARQHIHKETGECVVPPRTADITSLFVYREIDASAPQRLGHEEP